MARHTLETLQHLLRDFESILDNCGTLCIKILTLNIYLVIKSVFTWQPLETQQG